jgi:hypothetical protein
MSFALPDGPDFSETIPSGGYLWWYLDGISDEQIGHDIWLTRNHHGAGFWDRGLGDLGDKLTEIAHSLGGSDAYVGDDGKVHLS